MTGQVPLAAAERVDGLASVEVLREDAALSDLGRDWADLLTRCAGATPFQSHAWVDSWWRAYGTPGRLRVVTVRRSGRLVAVAPMMLRRRGPARLLVPLGHGHSDFTDVLVDERAAAATAPVLAAALLAVPGWRTVDFAETRPEAAARRHLLPAWPGRHWTMDASRCAELPVAPVADVVAGLPPHSRKTVRHRLNQIERLGLTTRSVPAADAAAAVGDLLRLHALQWEGRRVNRSHVDPRFAAHLGVAVPRMIAGQEAELLEYRLGGDLVASSLVVLDGRTAGGYLYGAHPGLRRIDVMSLLVTTALDLAHRRGCTTLSMLRGVESHKQRWRPQISVNQRLVLARPGRVEPHLYATTVRAASRLRREAGDRLPVLREVHDRGLVPVLAGRRRHR